MGFALTLVYLAFTLLRPQELFLSLVGYQIMDVLAGVALVGTLVSLATASRPRLPLLQMGLILGLILWASLTVILALRWFGGAALAFDALSTNAFLFLLIVLNVSSVRGLWRFDRAVVLIVLVLLSMGFHSYFSGWRSDQFVMLQGVAPGTRDTRLFVAEARPPAEEALDEGDRDDPAAKPRIRYIKRMRALGFLNDPNDLAQMLIVTLPFAFALARPKRPFRNSVVVGIPAAALVTGVLLTGSRGGLVGLAALAWATGVGRFRSRVAALLNLGGVLALAGLLVLTGRLGQLDGSMAGRVEAWSAGLQMLKSSPVWGVGFGFFHEHHGRVAHNSLVHVFAEVGLVGFFLWLGALVVTLQGLARLRNVDDEASEADLAIRRMASAARLALIGFVVTALFLSRGYSVTLFIVLGFATALVGVGLKHGLLSEPRLVAWVPATLLLQMLTVVLVYATVVLGR